MSGKNDPSRQPAAARPVIEWIAGAISALVIVALVAFLVHRALFRDAVPPQLSATIEKIERIEGGTLVTVAVANGGDEAAAGVRVHASRRDAGRDAMLRQIEFDYVAGHAVRRGAFLFPDAQLAPGDLEIRIGGFIEP